MAGKVVGGFEVILDKNIDNLQDNYFDSSRGFRHERMNASRLMASFVRAKSQSISSTKSSSGYLRMRHMSSDVPEEAPMWAKRSHNAPIQIDDLTTEEAVVKAMQAFVGKNFQKYAEISHIIRKKQKWNARSNAWSRYIGKRYSKKRAITQLVAMVGIGILLIVGAGITSNVLEPDNVLRLGNKVVQDDMQIREFQDSLTEIPDQTSIEIQLEYMQTKGGRVNVFVANQTSLQVWAQGGNLSVIEELHFHNVSLVEKTKEVAIPNAQLQPYYFILCPIKQMVCTREAVHQVRATAWDDAIPKVNVSFEVEIVAECCLCDGKHFQWLLVFMPFVLVLFKTFFVHEILFFGKSYSLILAQQKASEQKTPDEEVDYWQPSPWDRKCPRILIFIPFLWKLLRKPTEPFYTWWRHENHFTWIFFPYRYERLSRWERFLIIYVSLLVTFYATFYVTVGSTLLSSLANKILGQYEIVKVYLVQMLPQPIVEAIFKEIFKFFYKARRSRERSATENWICNYFTANTCAMLIFAFVHFPLVYILTNQSCVYVTEFFQYFLIALLLRMSIAALLIDVAWYYILMVVGYQDLCQHCTQRLGNCICFNDELLILAISKFGPRWNLIKNIDLILSDISHDHGIEYHPQFAGYSTLQLQNRWEILVHRAQNKIHLTQLLSDIHDRGSLISRRLTRMSRRNTLEVEDQPAPPKDTTRYLEKKILSINESLDHSVEDVQDDLLSTEDFLAALKDINFAEEPDARRAHNMTVQEDVDIETSYFARIKNGIYHYFAQD